MGELRRIGFIGLGNMGGPLAKRFAQTKPLVVFDLDQSRIDPIVALGAKAADSVADLAEKTDLVFVSLPNSETVKEVVLGDGGLSSKLSKGSLIVDMTTGDPNMTREIAKILLQKKIEFIDAPVSGGPRGAQEGNIAIMVGGSLEQYNRISPILRKISTNVIYSGELGSGHAIKAGNNLLNLICRLATFEVVSLLVKDGVDPETAVNTIQKSSGRNYATEITLPDNILSGKMNQGFTTSLMYKDSNVALNLASLHDLEMPLGTLASALLSEIGNDFGWQADLSTIALSYEAGTGARIRPKDRSK